MIYGSAAVSLLIVSVALFVSVRILDPEFAWRYTVMGVMIRLLNRVMFFAGALALLFGLGGYLSIGLMLVLLVIWLAIYMRRRQMRKQSLLSLISVATERGAPLIACIDAFAAEEVGAIARKAARLARGLKLGLPLVKAINANRGALPRDTNIGVSLGTRLDALGPALQELNAVNLRQDELTQAILVRLLAVWGVLTVGPFIVAFVMYKIVPSFVKIFEDFNTELPPMTMLLIDFSSHFGAWMAFVIKVVLLLCLLYLALIYIGWAPGMGFVRRSLERGRILRALALATERQVPLPEILELLVAEHPTTLTWYRLRSADRRIHEGTDWCESLHASGIIRRGEAAILSAAQRAGNLPWALREVAQRAEERLLYRMALAIQIISPIIVFLLGGVVGFVVIALFLPLVKLISDLT